MKDREIWLIRHGKPVLPDGGKRYYGTTDLSLSDQGAEAIGKLGAAVRKQYPGFLDAACYYSSPLLRATDSAEAFLDGAGIRDSKEYPVILEDLREISLGAWEGRLMEEIRAEDPKLYRDRGLYPDRIAPPGGESFLEAGTRFAGAVDRILKETEKERPVVVFTHTGVIRAYLAVRGYLRWDEIFRMKLPYGSAAVLEEQYGPGISDGPQLLRFGWQPGSD